MAIFVEEVVRDFDKNEVFEEITAKFTWEQDVERSWNLLVENNGILQHVNQENIEEKSKQKYKKNQECSLRKGIFRHIIILFDMSSSMKERDFKPDRINVVLECVETFLKNFFFKNPVGHVGVVALKNSSAKLIQPFTSNADDILKSLVKERSMGLQGSPSLQEGLEIAHDLLIDMPLYGTKEILIIYTCKIPAKCKVCGIHLISMHDLSHITNNLQGSPLFVEIKNEKNDYSHCSSCNQRLYDKVSQCTKCKNIFCLGCDIFIHEDLNQCPFCLNGDN
ncbi:transcription factor [Plasmodium ovale wallikeri]|uniref:Transcription factor n=1 Tax=Plasmodium ovale wallikeri TaxID=864142 RepID=A0A1A8ZU51_PLAOA|nr:transcription factor [Plasmodium ovale wallikeri]SBT48092.1 transcription factor [Plasmodium ovale wallikeri]